MTQLHSLSFFVLDEADRMIERGHFHELQSIIEMLPLTNGSDEQAARTMPNCETVPILQIKKRQTFVFSATLALSSNFRKKLKRGLSTSKASTDDVSSIEALSKQAGMKPNAEIVDLTKASILPEKLEESFIEYAFFHTNSFIYNWHLYLFYFPCKSYSWQFYLLTNYFVVIYTGAVKRIRMPICIIY